MHSEKNGSI